MSIGVKSLRFWGKNSFACIGISAGMALIIFLMRAMGVEPASGGGFGEAMLELLPFYPYYLSFAGLFIMLMAGIGYIQFYFPVLVSMNVTRKTVFRDFMIFFAVTALCLMILTGLLWYLIPGELSAMGLEVLPFIFGTLLMGGAFGMIFGVINFKYGTLGVIILMAVGGILGAFIAMSVMTDAHFRFLNGLSIGKIVWGAVAAGLLIYVFSGIFLAIQIRKLEIRA